VSRRRADAALAAIRHTALACLLLIGLWSWLCTPAGAAEVNLGPGAAPAPESEPLAAPLSTLGLLLLAAGIGAIRSRRAARRDPKPQPPPYPWPSPWPVPRSRDRR
jgi:hypothetical protein